jgi:predicted lipid-binding transport protein (Tim44 family)
MFGGWGGMLGGLVLGGLVGSLLFGHGGGFGGGGGGGFGLLELVLVAGLGFLLVSFLRRRTAQPASPAGYAPGSWGTAGDMTSAPASATTSNGTTALGASGAAAVALANEDLPQGIAAIRTMDPSFDLSRFVPVATDLFTRLQIGWSGEDLAAVRAHLTDEMAVALEKDLARLHGQGRRNRVEDVQVESAEVTEAWQEYGRDLVTVRFRARALDYAVDATTGQVVEGNRTTPVTFDEYWTFTRAVGPNSWRLGAIQQPTAA